jgi:hypothetical protein
MAECPESESVAAIHCSTKGRTSWAWMLVESDGRETKCTVRLAESIREHVGYD